MLTVAMSRQPVAAYAIDDMQEVQAGLQMIEQSMDIESTRSNQDLFLKVVLIWLHNVLETESSGLRLGMAIGLLTGIHDIVDSSATLLKMFSGQLEAQLHKSLLPATMALRCMHRVQYAPNPWPAAFAMTGFDFDQTIPDVAHELYQNNKQKFSCDFLILSEKLGSGIYTSMTLLHDDPRHQDIVLFEDDNHGMTFWTGKWLFTFDFEKIAYRARLDPEPAAEVVLSFTSKDPLGRWMAEHHWDEMWDVYERGSGATTAGQNE